MAPGHPDSGLVWFTSSYSSSEGGHCVEVAACPHAVHVRDTKDRRGQRLTVAPTAWSAFVGCATEGACAPD